MTCPYCGEPIGPNEGYPQWKCRYHDGCWELKQVREAREGSDRSPARPIVSKSEYVSKKDRGTF